MFVTSANIAAAIVKLVATEAIEAFTGELVLGNIVNRDFDAVLANAGDTVSVPMFPSLDANNIAETGNVILQPAALGAVEVTLNCHAEASFTITDIAKALTNIELARGLIKQAMAAIARKVEQDILGQYPLLTFNSIVGGAAAISESVVDDAETALWKAKVPPTEPKYLMVTGGTYADLRLIQRFTEVDKLGPAGADAIQRGVLGKIKDFNVLRSHFVQTTGGPVAHNVGFTRDCFCVAVRRLPLPLQGTGTIGDYGELGGYSMRTLLSYNPNSLAQQFTVDILYGAHVLRAECGVEAQTNTV